MSKRFGRNQKRRLKADIKKRDDLLTQAIIWRLDRYTYKPQWQIEAEKLVNIQPTA